MTLYPATDIISQYIRYFKGFTLTSITGNKCCCLYLQQSSHYCILTDTCSMQTVYQNLLIRYQVCGYTAASVTATKWETNPEAKILTH